MKTLNQTSTATLNNMVSLMEDCYVKIDNSDGTFMPVSVEMIYENDHFKIYSVAHYHEQCGDLLADPEMCFIYLKSLGLYYPSYFKQDSLGLEQESIIVKDGEIHGCRPKMQADNTEFANMWLQNIKNQQNL